MQLQALKDNLANLSANDQRFAADLIRAAESPRGCSPKQAYWVDQLADRALGAQIKQAPESVGVGNVEGLVTLFEKARRKLKKPSFLLQTASGETIKLFMLTTGKNPGSIAVTDLGKSFEDRRFYGRITREGEFQPSQQRKPEGLLDLLKLMAEKPAQAAAAYGKLTGKCCFCSLPLSDERSTAVGYGPICAGNWGLPWGAPVELVAESIDPEILQRIRELEDEYALVVDSDDPQMIAPIVDELRALEKLAGVEQGYHISGSVYDG